MSSKQSKNRFGKMNAVVIDNHVLLADSTRLSRLKELGQHRAKKSIVFVITSRPIQLAAHPVDQSSSISFLVGTRRLDFELVAPLAPTARHSGQEGQIDLI